MIILKYFGCDSDTIKVVKYAPKRVNIFFRGSRHTMIKLILTLQTSATTIESPKLASSDWLPVSDTNPELATSCQFVF